MKSSSVILLDPVKMISCQYIINKYLIIYLNKFNQV